MHCEKAFTLIEIVIAIFISALIGLIIIGSYITGNRINTNQEGVIEIQQNLRVGLQMMARDLWMAGYEISPHWSATSERSLNQINANTATPLSQRAGSDNIRIRYKVSTDGGTTPTASAVVLYYVDTSSNLRRYFNDTTVETDDIIATNISALWITYFVNTVGDTSSEWRTEPANPPSATPSSWTGITLTRSVGITLIGQSSKLNKDVTAEQVFREPHLGLDQITFPNTDPADRYTRRMASTVVELKNMNAHM